MDVLQKHRTSLFNKFSKEFADLDKELRLVLSQREERASREKEVLESELNHHKSKAALTEQLEKENEELRARLATHVVSTADAGTSPPSLRQPSPSRQDGRNDPADVQRTGPQTPTEKVDEHGPGDDATVSRTMYDDLLNKHNTLSKRYGDLKQALDRMIAKYRGEKDTIDAWIEYYRKQNPNWKDGASKLKSIRGPDDATPSASEMQPGAEGFRHASKDNIPDQPGTSPSGHAIQQGGNGHDAEAPSRNTSLLSGAPTAASAVHPPTSADGGDIFRRPATPVAGRQTHAELARQLPMTTPIKREAREVYSPDSTQDLSGLAASRNQTLQVEPLHDSMAEAESELPVLVSERSLKRKRPLRALSHAGTNLGAKLGTASDPVKVKSEPNSSSSVVAAALGETVSDSLDLDEVSRTVRTPRKSRELQQTGLPSGWRIAPPESPTRVRRGSGANARERFLAQAACFDSEASEDDEMEDEIGDGPEDVRLLTPAAESSPRRQPAGRPSHAASNGEPSNRYDRASKRPRLSSQEVEPLSTRRPRNTLHHAAELPAAQGESTRRGRNVTPSIPDTTDTPSVPSKADDHHPLRGATAKPRVRKALQPTSTNLRLPRNGVGSRSKTRSRDAKRDRSPAELDVAKLAFVAEDGDVLSHDASQGDDDAAAVAVTTPSRPLFRADAAAAARKDAASGRVPPLGRLNDLLEQPSPAKRLLTPEKPAHSATAARNEARRNGKGRAGTGPQAGTGTTAATAAETSRPKATPTALDTWRRRAKHSRSPDAAQDALITPPATVDASATTRRRKADNAVTKPNPGAGAGAGAGAEAAAEDEAGPLRSRPLSRLELGDFRVNPHAKANQGANYAFAESVRTNERRQCLPGCTRPECCGDVFRRMIEIAGMPPAPRQPRLRWNSSSPPPPPPRRKNGDDHGQSRRYDGAGADDDDDNGDNGANNRNDYDAYDERNVEDERLLRDFLGDNSAERLRRASPAERRELLLQAQTRRVADAHGKHRQAFARRTTPPGFWRTDMPTTQEMEAYHEEARRLERAKVHERYAEAMRPGGRWVFADEAR